MTLVVQPRLKPDFPYTVIFPVRASIARTCPPAIPAVARTRCTLIVLCWLSTPAVHFTYAVLVHICRSLLILAAFIFSLFPSAAPAQLSKGHQILLNRGLQIQGIVSTYDTFHLDTFSNANYTTVNWLWSSPRSFSGSMPLLGQTPGFPWGRWVTDETDVPPQGDESGYLSQLVTLQLGDEWELNTDSVRTRAVDWFNSISTNWPNTILYANNGGGQVSDGNLIDFVSRAHPDMITFDTYPWKSVYDTNQPDHIGPAIGGPPTTWYSVLRIYRDISRAFGIPFGSYVQTFHAVEEYYPYNVYRDPSPSELRLNHFGALVFDAKMLIDFHYNNGSSSLFTAPGGDTHPNALYYEKADCAARARNFGKALVRLKPVDEATTQWTTSVVFIRGRTAGGALNGIPLNFYAGPGGANLYTDWVYQRNDLWLTNTWTVTNKGVKNNGQPGDVILGWFKPLDESFDGPGYTNEVYLMVVNGLSDPTGSAADCLQQIVLNFNSGASGPSAVDALNPATGLVQSWQLPLVNGARQLVLNLNGGDAALFKFADGAPFVGASPAGGPPQIIAPPQSRTNAPQTDATFGVVATGTLPLSYQWRFNGTNISGATTNSYTRANVQISDSGGYTVVISNSEGSVTSAPAVLTINSLILYEPFDYSNFGAPVSSNTPANWVYGGSGTNDLNVTSGNLAYAGLAASAGNSITNGGLGLGVRRLLGASISSGALYFSALFRINDPGFGAWNGLASQAGAFTAADNSSFRLQVMVKSNSPAGYVIGVQKGGTGVSSAFDTTERHAGETVFLAGKYDFTTLPQSVTLWINPNPATFGAASPPATGFLSANTGTDGTGSANTIDRFNIRQNVPSGASSVPAAMQWDELRVGYLWSDVTPVPPSFRLTNLSRLPEGRFQFSYTNTSSATPMVYASSNLIDWLAIGAATQVAPGYYQFTDAASTNLPRRFYELRGP